MTCRTGTCAGSGAPAREGRQAAQPHRRADGLRDQRPRVARPSRRAGRGRCRHGRVRHRLPRHPAHADRGHARPGGPNLVDGRTGYEIVVPANRHLALHDALLEQGRRHGLRIIGDLAFDSLRLEKGYGIWSAEFRHHVTPVACGLDRFVAPDKGAFIGREAFLRDAEAEPDRRLVLLRVDADDADAGEGDPIRADGVLIGEVTSGRLRPPSAQLSRSRTWTPPWSRRTRP
ncbi:MAG: hypothetical protein U0838_06640 [Chloroflexota bacterium]